MNETMKVSDILLPNQSDTTFNMSLSKSLICWLSYLAADRQLWLELVGVGRIGCGRLFGSH